MQSWPYSQSRSASLITISINDVITIDDGTIAVTAIYDNDINQ